MPTKYLNKLREVHPTGESDSAVCIPLGSQTPRCASYLRVKVPSVHYTTESSDPISQKTLQCASHRGVKLRSVHHTTESRSVVCITPQSQTCRSKIFVSLWLPLKGQSGEILLGVNTYCILLKKRF